MKATLALLLLASVCSIAHTQTLNYRLPTTVLPSNYNLEITPYFAAEVNKGIFTFDGIAKITLRTSLANILAIELNALNLSGPVPTLVEALVPSASIVVSSVVDDPATQKRTLTLAGPLRPNIDYVLTFTYTGFLNEEMNGFYRSSYVENNQTKWLGTTQMQPVHARKVFPCFDEPSFKATFDITINRLNGWSKSYSNTKIISTTVIGTRTKEVFRTTPIMSTYLLAFIVSEFRVRENSAETFAIIARPDAYDQTVYAFDIGQSLLAKLDEWTAYPHNEVPAIEKMHMAALPDFSAGAMENWGLLTYRETNQLYDPNYTTALQQQRIAAVIAHEQAHLWFGDLVTCQWWGYTWLNEGFARYFQYFGTALVESNWDLEMQFVVEQIQGVMGSDSLSTTHAMSFEVNSPAEIGVSFDSISYNKGASVLRMIEHWMGSINFQRALQAYFRVHEFKNVVPADLYAALQLQANVLNIANILETWTTQQGYPVVMVERMGDLTYTISQERFLLKDKNHTDATLWEIPLTYASSSQLESFAATQVQHTLTKTEKTKNITVAINTEWKIFNVQQTGYYRVNYDNDTWTAIGNALKANAHSGIHTINRAQIVDDILNLARAGHVDYWQALSVVQYLENEEHYIPWLSAFNNLLYVSRRFSDAQLVTYKKHVLALIKNIYAKLQFNPRTNDTRTDIYNRVNVLSYACKFGHEDCIRSATDEYRNFRVTENYLVPINIRSVVYCTAISAGGDTEWDFLWNRYAEENVATEQITILTALGCTLNQTILFKYMDLIVSGAVRAQDKATAFTATYNERIENVPVVYEFVTTNFVFISNNWGGMPQVASILSNLAARFTSQQQIDSLQNFYDTNVLFFAGSTTVPNAIADAKFNLEWANEHLPVIVNYLEITAGSSTLTIGLVLIFSTLFSLFC